MEPVEPTWRKSTYTTANGGDCVELAQNSEEIAVRDSKHPDGTRLRFTPRGFQSLVRGLKES